MGITVKNISDVFNKDVFTNRGVFCGVVSDIDINLSKFRINSLVVETGKGSFLSDMIGGKKGVIIPYALVINVGDVVIIKHITPTMPPETQPQGSDSASADDFQTIA
jgi:sporulation protein YlmC with PRC-barrel domain